MMSVTAPPSSLPVQVKRSPVRVTEARAAWTRIPGSTSNATSVCEASSSTSARTRTTLHPRTEGFWVATSSRACTVSSSLLGETGLESRRSSARLITRLTRSGDNQECTKHQDPVVSFVPPTRRCSTNSSAPNASQFELQGPMKTNVRSGAATITRASVSTRAQPPPLGRRRSWTGVGNNPHLRNSRCA